MSDEQKRDAQRTRNEQWSALVRVVELFRRYYSGEASPHEQKSIETWKPVENEEELANDHTFAKECDTASVWNAISHELKFDNQPRFFIKKHIPIAKKQRHYAAAAILFILLCGGTWFFTQNKTFNHTKSSTMAEANTFFQTTDAEDRQISLPDGSKIHLNRGTKLGYASNTFNRKQREVWLKGEAFFEVAKIPDKPFIIHAGDMTTTVRGTSFNVKAYPQLVQNVVTVLTGKVEVKANGKVLAMLTHDKQIEYNKKTNASLLMNMDAEEAISWQNGGLILNYAGKDELKLRIKQLYNIDIQFKNNALDDIKIKSSFAKGTSLADVLATIEALYGVKCNTLNNKIIIDKQ